MNVKGQTGAKREPPRGLVGRAGRFTFVASLYAKSVAYRLLSAAKPYDC
jgi:hypothetical protein